MTSKQPTLIVGIGASAGGLKPIEDFFDHMPSDCGMAFVVVQHLSPDFKSLMDELLARHTKMAIHKVSDGVTIEPNSIYLIPPTKNMVMSEGKLLLTDKTEDRGLNLPIDIFFSSLAAQARENAVAVVLSGTGSDGSRGIKEVREAGGLVLVQSTETAGFDGMPQAAIATGTVDLICAPSEMPDRLISYVENQDRKALQQKEFDSDSTQTPTESATFRLFRLYRQRNNLDFSLYKPATIMRRLERRMRMREIRDLADYVDLIESDNDESEQLFRDLLVEVTHFFRDPEAFQRLSDFVVPDLLARLDPDSEVRIWVCGCATGEEAYSIAMVLHDCISKSDTPDRPFKVFATDVHQKSLQVASNGFYPSHVLDTVPQEFQKYFVRNNGICNIKRELRQSVIFAANDLTRDPPFTRIDLISCRNVLIYLEPKVQKRILSMFHFGLRTKGVLFLGPSETVGDLANEFEQLDRHWRIYSKRRDIRLPEATRMPLTPVLGSIVHEQSQSFVASGSIQTQMWLTNAYEDLLTKYVPPSLLINDYHELVHCFGEARKLLTPPEGKPTNDVLKMLDDDLSVAVSAALHRAKSESKPVVYKGVRVRLSPDDERLFRVAVEPYQKTDQSLFLVCLEEMEKVVREDKIVEDFETDDHSAERLGQLERELKYTRETLQATVEELESSNEELQATNEELIASNEELQSTNEELHSVNEELYTVNTEHKEKIEELTQLTSDMDNLLISTEIGTIFLDREFQIRMFTPSISAGFNVLEQDIGRPINHIAYKLDSPNLLSDAAEVLTNGNPKEIEVHGKDGQMYLQRIQPYRVEDRIEGIVLTLTDVTALKEAEQVRQNMRTLSEISNELPDFAYAVSHDLQAPLRHISQYADILESAHEVGNQENVQKAIKVVKESSSKLREMIDSLLAYSRINTLGKNLEPINLEVPIESAINELESTLAVDNATVWVQPDLPKVLGDRDQLKLLFYHLIENSIKFRGDADPKVEIRLANRKDQTVEISVIDNGIGIPERYQEEVFTMFKRLGNKENVPGIGVGLTICRRIALRHNGQIFVSPCGSGAAVHVRLRIPNEESDEADSEPAFSNTKEPVSS